MRFWAAARNLIPARGFLRRLGGPSFWSSCSFVFRVIVVRNAVRNGVGRLISGLLRRAFSAAGLPSPETTVELCR
jgi:hypothetical protein